MLSYGCMIWLLAHLSPLFRQYSKHRKTEEKRQYAQGRGAKGVGEEPNNMTKGKPGPLYIIQYSLDLGIPT
jgi:hypothetical protein